MSVNILMWKVPCRLTCLSTWSWDGSVSWEVVGPSGGGAQMEKVGHWGMGSRAWGIYLLPASWTVEMWAASAHINTRELPAKMIFILPWRTISQQVLNQYKSLFPKVCYGSVFSEDDEKSNYCSITSGFLKSQLRTSVYFIPHSSLNMTINQT